MGGRGGQVDNWKWRLNIVADKLKRQSLDHLKQDFSLFWIPTKDKIKQNTVFVSKTHKRIHKEAKKFEY